MKLPILTLAVALLAGCSSRPELPATAPSALLEKTVPQFQRKSIGGAKVGTVESKGKTTVIKFFAEYCEPCKRTLPATQRLHRKHPEVVFLGVSEDERVQTAAKIRREYGLTFPIVHDKDRVLSGRFRVKDMPITFVVDREGNVRWVGGPAQTEAELAQAIAAVEY